MQESGYFTDIESVTQFCQLVSHQPQEALHELGAKLKKKLGTTST